ncbi:hypothetical protein AC1031_005253 [Aphanomyces cochlioides]|nr:hypothetical protein AC1031_005253 [Aphanomyces cochlioides]
MKQDLLRNYIKRVAKDDKEIGQLSEPALQSLRMATEFFVDEISQAIDEYVRTSKEPVTGNTLKELLLASKSKTFARMKPLLESTTISSNREKPLKRKAASDAALARKTPHSKKLKREREFMDLLPSVSEPPPPPPAVHPIIEEDDDYDASD